MTIRANHGQPHLHPHDDRFPSVREMARLQGFPDSFVFEGRVSETQRRVANAIPPPLAEHIALALRPLLDAVSERPDDAAYLACPRTATVRAAIAVALPHSP